MKTVKCDRCKRERRVEDNVILSVCPGCQCEMMEVKYDILPQPKG